MYQRTGQGHALTLTARELGGPVVQALAQPDRAGTLPSGPNAPAWLDGATVLSHAEVCEVAPVEGRVLVPAGDPLGTLRAAVIAPLLGGGSAVVVEATDDAARIEAIRRTERCVE